MSSANNDSVQRLPSGLFIGATQLRHGVPTGDKGPVNAWDVGQMLGVRRLNDQCVELQPADTTGNRQLAAGWVGRAMLVSIFASIAMWLIAKPDQMTSRVLLEIIFIPWLLVIFALFIYVFSGAWSNRGTFIRLHRGTRKLYYVPPGEDDLITLDWDQLVPMAGYMPTFAAGVYTTRHPLFLVGVDRSTTPARERCMICGNLGWRDDGQTAKQLWDYLQCFMAEGSQALIPPPPVPPRGTRTQSFTRRFHEWSAELRKELPTAKDRWHAPWQVFWKGFWLVTDVFPDALGDWLQYNVPYTRFPKAIDELCDMSSPRVDGDES
jgi:hypothetical protein